MTTPLLFAGILSGLGIAGLIGIVLLALIVFFVIGLYNGLVKKRNQYRNAFAQIDVQLKRRHDLIPNLIETAKKFMSHERETLEGVIAARSAATGARSAAAANPDSAEKMGALVQAEQGLTSSLGQLFALREDYPDLKSNENMMQLTEELSSTENKVAFARQSYNDSVTSYNNKRETFPSNFFASAFNFKAATLFEVAETSERESVQVDFN